MTLRWSFSLVFALWMNMLLPSAAPAQGIPFAVGGDNVESESSMMPFQVKVRGILNATARGKSLGMVSLGINPYHEKYDFDVMTAEAIDNPRISGSAILRQYKDRQKDLNLAGPKELLSKIGQAEPGTPLAIVGFFTPRDRSLRLESVSAMGMGMDKY